MKKVKVYVLQHKKIKSVYVWNDSLTNPGYLKFKNYFVALVYKFIHDKWSYKIVKQYDIIHEEEV